MFNEEDKIYKTLEYQGNRICCNECLYRPRTTKEDVTKYTPCKMIDHDRFRLYKTIFNGYEGSIATTNICCHYEPTKWNISGQREWKGVDAYIEFLDKYFYHTPKFLDYNKIRDTTTGGVTICIGGFDTYGELQYQVSLYDWITGNWFKDNRIKYITKRGVLRTPSGRPNKLKTLSYHNIDDLTEFLETDKCDYLKKEAI